MAKSQIRQYVFTPGAAGVGTIQVPGKVDLQQLLVITNTTRNVILYNFADVTYAGTTVAITRANDITNWFNTLDNTDGITTITLPVSTVGQSSTDTLQIFFEKPELITRPWDMGTDGFERTRVSPPQSMIDADFEYGIQPTKWLTISQERGYPSIYEIPGTDTTVSAIITDASIGTGGAATSQSLITVTTVAAHGLSIGNAITLAGLDSSITGFERAQGSFVVYAVPSATSFTFYAKGKVGYSNGDSLYTAAVQLRLGGFYTGSNINAVINATALATTSSGNYVTLTTTTGMTAGSGIVFNTIRTNAVATNSVTQIITLGTNIGMQPGMPLSFSGTSFGGIATGTTYYVVSIQPGATQDNVSITMSINPSLTPVFIPTVTTTGGNMNVVGGASFGNLVAGTQYYIGTVANSTQVTVSNNVLFTTTINATSAVNNSVSLGTTTNITVGELFTVTSGSTIGNLAQGTYYVVSILDGSNVTISSSSTLSPVFTQTTAYGSMTVSLGQVLALTTVTAGNGYLSAISTGQPTFTYSNTASSPSANFTASLTSGSTGQLVVTAVASGALAIGQGIQTTGQTVPSGCVITAQVSGTAGQAGTYTVNVTNGSVSSTNTFYSVSVAPTITVNTYVNHGFVPGQTINVVVTSDNGTNNHTLAQGPYYVENVTSLTTFTYTARGIGTIQPTTTIVGSLYARVDSFFQHRPFDGGVQLGTGNPAHGLQAIRMSKKYIRYQSGKGINFNTGLLMAPNYFVRSVTANGTAIGSVITIVTDDVDHGCQIGARVSLQGVLTLGFNGTYTVTGIVDERTLQVTAFQTLGAISPTTGASIQDPCLLSFVGWTGATVRSGTYDEQNGVFFEFDGSQAYVVKRASTFQLAGTVSVVAGSGQVIGINSRFATQLVAGDRVVMRGMTHVVTQVVSPTLMYVNPQWRGATSINGIKITKTIDYKIPQSQWNKDRFDGTSSPFNPSGYLMTPSKMQMVGMQWTWYGAGSIDWMMRGDDGNYKFVHRLRNNNLNNEGWMRTGNMPVRYEVQNEGARSYIVGAGMGSGDLTMSLWDTTFFPVPASGYTQSVYVDNEIITYTNKTNAYATATTSVGSLVILSNTTNMVANQPIVFNNSQGLGLGNIATGTTYYVLGAPTVFTGTILGVTYTNAPAIQISTIAGSGLVTQANAVATTQFNGLQTTGSLLGCSRAQTATLWATGGYRTFGAGSATAHAANTGVILVAPTASPVVSHWGAAFVQDGGFDTDRSYIFSYQSPNITITTKKTCAFAVRQAPSVSNALTGDLGLRELINRASFLLQALDITAGTGGANAALVIEGVINPSNYPTDLSKIPFYSLNSTTLPTGQPSFSQVAPGAGITFANSATNITTVTNTGINTIGGTSFTVSNTNGIRVGDDVYCPTVTSAFFSLTKVASINGTTITLTTGVAAAVANSTVIYFSRNTAATPGETIFSFIGSPANKDSLDLSLLKELTNTPIGGRGCYPNGPDVLFINVYITQGTVIANLVLRWGEAQA